MTGENEEGSGSTGGIAKGGCTSFCRGSEAHANSVKQLWKPISLATEHKDATEQMGGATVAFSFFFFYASLAEHNSCVRRSLPNHRSCQLFSSSSCGGFVQKQLSPG